MTSLTTTRRGLLSFIGGAAGVATFGPIVPARTETRELAWLTWETNGKPAHIVPFEKTTGITVMTA
jgi:spermidine/putrescine-binding protein